MSKKTIDINNEFKLTPLEKYLVMEISPRMPMFAKTIFQSKTEAQILKKTFFVTLINILFTFFSFFHITQNSFLNDTVAYIVIGVTIAVWWLTIIVDLISTKQILNNANRVKNDIFETYNYDSKKIKQTNSINKYFKFSFVTKCIACPFMFAFVAFFFVTLYTGFLFSLF